MALTPLNMSLARDLVNRTRVSAALAGGGGQPAADLDALGLTLNQISSAWPIWSASPPSISTPCWPIPTGSRS